jgi:hypothetical protein
MTSHAWRECHSDALQQLYDDVGENRFKHFSVNDLPSGIVERLGPIHPEVARKSSHFTVVTSGADEANRHWMILFAHRVDSRPGSSENVTDLDPIVTVLDANRNPAMSGMVTHHAHFSGRTEGAGVYSTIDVAVSSLQQAFTPTSGCYNDADDRLKTGVQWAVKYFLDQE